MEIAHPVLLHLHLSVEVLVLLVREGRELIAVDLELRVIRIRLVRHGGTELGAGRS
jgi:hypothetical protein